MSPDPTQALKSEPVPDADCRKNFEIPDDQLEGLLKQFNLLQSEYGKIKANLNRPPNFNELAMFSVLWSEHCCYKNSRHLLKQLPSTGDCVVAGPGENAGIVDVGDGIQIAFKIESHNHPTAVEPFQGAATGVGGILRDIFTMNARPIANLNALRFGPVAASPNLENKDTENNSCSETNYTETNYTETNYTETNYTETNYTETNYTEKHNRYLFSRAVNGIAHYGNCVGVPTIAGDVFFEDCYNGNPLVNAMAVGILYDRNDISSKAYGVGNPVLYVGSATGKDGMGGAAFASKALDENSTADRPAVQVGDPFAEKLLIESCLEAFATGHVVAAQDMGAAGLTSSSAEMAAKGNVGIQINLDAVPAREPGMQPHEYLLSESQERMLLVIERGKTQAIQDIFTKWGVASAVIGEITADCTIDIRHHNEQVACVPAKLLTDLAPSYHRQLMPDEPPSAKARREKDVLKGLPDINPQELRQFLEKMMRSQNIAKPVGVIQQYDRHVQNATVLDSAHLTAGVIRLRQKDGRFSGKALSLTVDCNPRYVHTDPYKGSLYAVTEAARNLACTGAKPLAVTDNLNFGNPERSEIYHQLHYAVQGIKDACLGLNTPVISGNVSLYNEYGDEAIYPTPTIGMAGLINDDSQIMGAALPAPKETLVSLALIGHFNPVLGSTEYLKLRTGNVEGAPPEVNVAYEAKAIALLLSLIDARQVVAVQDVSLGGVLPTLLEMAFFNEAGLDCSQNQLSSLLAERSNSGKNQRLDLKWFGETACSYIIAYEAGQEEPIWQAAEKAGLSFARLGETTNDHFALKLTAEVPPIDLHAIKQQWLSVHAR
ncbi:MAG: phosphoribosylformylglycinamidine synthase subunit PurL [Cyanobacteria bacterium P01_H01_bin.74]